MQEQIFHNQQHNNEESTTARRLRPIHPAPPSSYLLSFEVVPKLKSWDWFKQNGSRRVLVLFIGQTPERWSRS
jgi:hypothetical protein